MALVGERAEDIAGKQKASDGEKEPHSWSPTANETNNLEMERN
jgi:hypothetical protein